VFHLRNANAAGPADVVLAYGRPGDTVLVGDWDGDGTDTLAVRRGREYHVKNSISGGPADAVAAYGRPDDAVYTGDWDGDGTDSLTVRRGSTYFIVDSFRAGPADRTVVYGRATDTTLVGDWDGDGTDSLGVRREVGHRLSAENALRAAVANDTADLARWTTPEAAEWMIYAFHTFYAVEGPFSIGECLADSATVVHCAVLSADFPVQPIGAMRVDRLSPATWTVTEYAIWAD
jgi:hypothetical protein